MVHVVSCHIVANVEIGWHARLLTNNSNMDMVKMSVADKSLTTTNQIVTQVLDRTGAPAPLHAPHVRDKIVSFFWLEKKIDHCVPHIGGMRWCRCTRSVYSV